MRLLLLDNHDSFTAILHHYLWELAGERPLLYRNDELTRDELEALGFDAAVLSPGPGHPARVRDFGACRDLLELFPDRPVLGVCLGMQGMAHFAGARVEPWPEARHGRPSRIFHDGTGVFRGLPDGFEAVRYHSLAVDATSLPPQVRVTARSDDGLVMGVSFADRPWVGVQFHPESFGTAHGRDLLRNFLDLARPGVPRVGSDGSLPSRGTPPERAVPLAPEAVPALEIPRAELSWREPAEVFARHFRAGTGPRVWLDGGAWGASILARADRVEEFTDWASWKNWVARHEPRPATAPWPGYRGGPLGQLSYELLRDTLGVAVQPDDGDPLARWMIPDGWLAFDGAAQRVFAAWPPGAEPPSWLRAVLDDWDAAVDPVDPGDTTGAGAAAGPGSAADSGAGLPPFDAWIPLLAESEHAARVRALQDAIIRGDTYEACLTHAWSVRAPEGTDPDDVYLRVRARNPAPYAAFLDFGVVRVLSASPELFLEADEGLLRGRPIKGTRRRSGDSAHDAALCAELVASEKDAAENRMIVDLTRHDFARVCRPGSVDVPAFLELEKHPAVFQLVSEVRGRLAPGVTAVDAVEACFPGGSMTGAPKERTVELLADLERAPRGIYSGGIGYFTAGGSFRLSMVIRTLEQRGDAWRTGCGGAILMESDAAAEWSESVVKARSVIDAAGFDQAPGGP